MFFSDHHAPAHPRRGVCSVLGVQTGPLHPAACATLHRACDAPPGAVVFHRFLHDINRTDPTPPGSRAPDCVEWSRASRHAGEPRPAVPVPPPPPPPPPPSGTGLLPKLGEVLPVRPHPVDEIVTEVRFIQRSPATGRLIDLLV